jgi:hypothetical protein
MTAQVISFPRPSGPRRAAKGESDLVRLINETRLLWRLDRERRAAVQPLFLTPTFPTPRRKSKHTNAT